MFNKIGFKVLSGLIALSTAAVIFYSCQPNQEIVSAPASQNNTTPKTSVISGQVISNQTGIPVDSAYVQVIGTSIYQSALTDAQGKYSLSVSLTANTNLAVIVSKSAFNSDTTAIYVTAGTDYPMSLIKLVPVNSGSGQQPSGNPISIFLFSQTASSIGVKESGSPETAGLTFEVQDSSGVPVVLNHSVDVNFLIGAQPNGGEFISPTTVTTNDQGQATVNLTSGTKAGVVQIIAQINTKSGMIQSKPVSIAIHGGLPDINHFMMGTSLLNVSTLHLNSYPGFVSVALGDKYANPVRTHTTVYFTSTAGYVQGSSYTDDLGFASATWVAAPPLTVDPIFGPGFIRITASTADENLQTISKTSVVLISGTPQISITPTTFDIPNGGSQSFYYSVSDSNGNPLMSGNTITVTVEGQNIGSEGDLNVNIPDTQSKSWTQFQFLVYDTADTLNVPMPVTIKILSDGPNGTASKIITGISR